MSLRQNYYRDTIDRLKFSYQSECHCAKTLSQFLAWLEQFSYQSECHCAKTELSKEEFMKRLVTSQNVTAPKLLQEVR